MLDDNDLILMKVENNINNAENRTSDNCTRTVVVVVVTFVVLVNNNVSLVGNICEFEMSDKSADDRDSNRRVSNENSRRQGCVVELDNYKYTIFGSFHFTEFGFNFSFKCG